MRRLIVCVAALAMLALPAGAYAAARNFVGANLGLGMKAYKNQVKELRPTGLLVNCDEGQTKADAGGPIVYKLQPPLALKHRKLHAEEDKTQSFAKLDPVTAEVIGVEHDRFHLSVHGKFNRRYTKASGTLRFTGSFRGPDPNAQYKGQMIQYHNCDSGTVAWHAHLFHYRAE
jgi:hypothetical protein